MTQLAQLAFMDAVASDVTFLDVVASNVTFLDVVKPDITFANFSTGFADLSILLCTLKSPLSFNSVSKNYLPAKKAPRLNRCTLPLAITTVIDVDDEDQLMKRQKRDLSQRAFHKGYQAGSSGRNKEQCPHNEGEIRQQWLSGWREGRTDQWDGLTGVSGIHKININ